jgi:WD40 repeat protein
LGHREVAITPDGRYIAAGGGSGAKFGFHFFDRQGDKLWSYKTGSYVGSVAISADGSYIVAGSGDRNVYLIAR